MGCVGVGEENLETITSEVTRCTTCDDNGLLPDAWENGRAWLAPPVTGPAGLYLPGGVVKPLCAPATSTIVAGGTHCELDPAWASWWRTGTLLEREYRVALVTYMVKVGGKKGDIVLDSAASRAMQGGFSLAPSILLVPWDVRAQSLVTAGMAVAVDLGANGVELCMKTEFTPDCPARYAYHEIAAVGNAFGGQPEIVIGGYDAVRPQDSTRVCTGYGPCNTYSSISNYAAAICTYTGAPTQRHPFACSPPGGPVFDYPVQVFTPFDPSIFGASGGTGPRL